MPRPGLDPRASRRFGQGDVRDSRRLFEQIDEFVEDGLLPQVEQPGIGAYLMPGSPLQFSASSRLAATRAPLLGEHTDEILSTVLELSDREIAKLHDQRVIEGP